MKKSHIFKEFISFIRVENAIFTSGIAISGFLIFNEIAFEILMVFLAMFFGTMASYSFNYIKDVKEDIANKRKLNYFVENETNGRIVVLFLYLTGIFFSFGLSFISWAIYAGLVVFSVLYSDYWRLKEKFLLKNIHTGFGIAISFLVGATATGSFEFGLISYVFVVFMLGFAANMLGDIRGEKGDKSIGMKTIPILIGIKRSKDLLNLILVCLILIILLIGQFEFYPLMPFVASALFFLSKNKLRRTRHSLLSSFAMMPLFLIIMTVGVI